MMVRLTDSMEAVTGAVVLESVVGKVWRCAGGSGDAWFVLLELFLLLIVRTV